MNERTWDAVVIGSGPNGLSAAIVLAQAGINVLVVEGAEQIGGGACTAELTLPGCKHDVCAAVFPLGIGSPFFQTLPLENHGLRWIHPEFPLAHPMDDGSAAVLSRSLQATGESFQNRDDSQTYQRLLEPLARNWEAVASEVLQPPHVPMHWNALARFGWHAIQPAERWAVRHFQSERARALIAGMAAHSILPLEKRPSAAFALLLSLAGHAVGWPVAEGGAGRISAALAGHFESLGGTIYTGCWVRTMDNLPPARAYLFDTPPGHVARIAEARLSPSVRRRLERFRHGPGVCKVDWVLDDPIPWRAAACRKAGTVHLGGTLGEIAASERAAWQGEHSDRPFVLLAQQSLFDASRAPENRHVVWAYCHVPSGSTVDMSDRIEAQVERFAPGFRQRIVGRHVMHSQAMQAHNPNLVGGDINGGVANLAQIIARPTLRWKPYATGDPAIWICSASTPPGGGVHGMCGYHAARAVLRQVFQHR